MNTIIFKSSFVLGIILSLLNSSCERSFAESNSNMYLETDHRVNPYDTSSAKAKEIKIGEQVWMLENLNVTHFQNGEKIPQAQTNSEWQKASNDKQPAWCWYAEDAKNGKKYGKLYNWYAVNHPAGLAPETWRIASDDDWTALTNFLGGHIGAAVALKSKMGWFKDGNGSNSTGFTALPSGYRMSTGGFLELERITSWWTSTEENPDRAWERSVGYGNKDVYRSYGYKGAGYAVRCVKAD